MSRTAPRTLSALALLTAGVVGAALLMPATAGAASAQKRPILHLHTTKNHHVFAPTHTRPGIAHLSNKGEAQIIVVEAKHPKQATATQVANGLNAKHAGVLLKNYRLIAVVGHASGVYTRLTRGSYFLADGYVSHFTAKDIRSMTVKGTFLNATPPVSRRASVTPKHGLHLPTTVAKRGWLHVQNASSSLADFFIEAVAAKTTQKQLNALIAHPSVKKLDKAVDYSASRNGFQSFSVFGSHSSTWVPYRGPAGRYVAVLYAYAGTPHPKLHHGQVRVLNLK